MSIDPIPNLRRNAVRWFITSCLGVLAIICVGWIASFGLGPERGMYNEGPLLAGFFILDILALTGLGVWILRPPVPGAVNFLGRWAGKVVLFLGLALAIIIFLFATCLGVALSSI
jgi:hypothetical protein